MAEKRIISRLKYISIKKMKREKRTKEHNKISRNYEATTRGIIYAYWEYQEKERNRK